MNSMNKILSTVILLGFILLCGCNTQPSPIRSGELCTGFSWCVFCCHGAAKD